MVKKITGNIKFSCKKPIEIIRSDAEKENIIKNWNDFIKNHVEDGIYNGKIYAVIDLIREKNKTIWVIAQTNFADYIYAKMTKKICVHTLFVASYIITKDGYYGIIDTCPIWDEDGKVYLAHAYAGSRAGLKSVIAICELSADATQVIGPSRIIFDGHEHHGTCEGPKLYKRNGYYYVFLPAGGVATGWQVVLRSRNIYGPYENRTVLAQGNSPVNGPHQGGWVDTPTGEDWFMHFQDVGAYGRVVHLQPMQWIDDWPVIGTDKDGDGCGEPVLTYRKPDVGKTYPVCTPQESDEFDGYTLSPQWQWHANINDKWAYYAGDRSMVRLYSYPVPDNYKSLWDVPNLLLQKTPSDNFTATMKLTFRPNPKYKGERTGLVVMGMDYAGLILENTEQGTVLSQIACRKADRGGTEKTNDSVAVKDSTLYLRVKFSADGSKVKGTDDLLVRCNFSYSLDGKKFRPLGETFQAREGKWIGAKVGTFCTRPAIRTNDGGWTDVDWFRITRK